METQQEQQQEQTTTSNPDAWQNYIEAVGQDVMLKSGSKKTFSISSDEDRAYYASLWLYFTDNEKCPWELNKGLVIAGDVGVGKSISFRVMNAIFGNKKPFYRVPCRQIADEFSDKGSKSLRKYGSESYERATFGTFHKAKPITWYFDDLGLEENNVKNYGNNSNVMAEILLSRYDGFIEHGMKTFATTNLDIKQIEERYGIRVRDRMREMFNWIVIKGVSKRK
jgi:DNA replication protein DnaC